MEICSFRKCFTFNKKLHLPRNFIYVGATQSGKTQLFLKTLEDAAGNYEPKPKAIYFLYSCFQDTYLELSRKLSAQGITVEFTQNTEFSEKDLDAIADSTGQTIIAIDDATMSTIKSSKLAHLFTVARHKNCSLVLMWHVLFGGTQESRIISQNTQYYFFMSSPRMQLQIANLGSQINMRKALVSAYKNAIQEPYNYILLDLNVNVPDFLRIRSKVLSSDKVQHVYVPVL